MTYDRAVYRVSVATDNGIEALRFEGIVKRLDAHGSSDTHAAILDKRDEGPVEYLVAVYADSYAHQVVEDELSGFGAHVGGIETTVETADVSVGVEEPADGCIV